MAQHLTFLRLFERVDDKEGGPLKKGFSRSSCCDGALSGHPGPKTSAVRWLLVTQFFVETALNDF